MAVTINGFSTNEIKAQPAFVLNRSENGAWSSTHILIFKAADFAAVFPNLKKGTLLSEIDPTVPSPFDDFITIDTISISRIEGDLYEVSINAIGSGSAQFQGDDEISTEVTPTYTLEGIIQESPLTQHRKFKELSEEEQLLYYYYKLTNRLDDKEEYDVVQSWFTQKGYFNIKSPTSEFSYTQSDTVNQFIDIESWEGDTFKKCVYTWTEDTEGTSQLTTAQLNKLGKITSVRGNPPTPTNERDWMLTSVSQEQSGGVYRTSLEWTLSDIGGHDAFLYSN